MSKIKIKPAFKDHRGEISDILYNQKINHVALINSKKNIIRGNHFHKKSTQITFVTKGKMIYFYKDLKKKNSRIVRVILSEKDLIETPPYFAHAYKMLTDNEFFVFSSGLRGGKDYEKDTFRLVKKLIVE